MPRAVDFYFDFSCPYAYLGSTQLEAIERETGASVTLRPFLLGGVFAHLRQPQNMSTVLSPPKKWHNRADLLRWADLFSAPLKTPFRHPNRTVEALRALLLCPDHAQRNVMTAFFSLYWEEAADISDVEVLRSRLDTLGLDGGAIMGAIALPATKQLLRDRTNGAINAGVFGAPAWVVDGQLFWGQDRIEMVKRAVAGWQPDLDSPFSFNQETSA